MVEVTAKNFQDIDLKKEFDDCSFVAMDGEFTGLRSGREFQLNIFDTAEERYRKHSAGSDGMFMIQVGLSVFKHLFMNEWKVSTYNFLISPRNPHFCVRDRYFTCQTSSLDLLFKSGFSFDRCFREGVTYISQAEESDCQRSLEQRAQRRQKQDGEGETNGNSNGRPTPNKAPWWQQFEENISKKLDEALLNGVECLGLSDFTEEERGVLLRIIERKYADKFVLLSNSIALLKDPSDWLRLHTEDLEKCSGFSSIVKQLSASGKPIVGHNVYLDLIHLYRQFIGPMPDDYEEAKEALHGAFPKVIDTKLLSSMEPLKDWVNSTALPELYKTVQRSPFKPPKMHNSVYSADSDDHLHQAGYDSYITGFSFISLADKLCALKDEKPGVPALDSTVLQPYFNKVFMFRSWDYNFISLDKRDTAPNRKNVFHVSFPSSFKTENIIDLFKACGRVQVGWINDTSAWVGLNDADQSSFATKRLCDKDSVYLPAGVVVKPWASASALQQKRKSDDDGNDTKNKRKKTETAAPVTNGEFAVPDQW